MKRVIFLIKEMSGGGAERVVSVLCNALVSSEKDVRVIITHQTLSDAHVCDLDKQVNVISLEDCRKKSYHKTKRFMLAKAKLQEKLNKNASSEKKAKAVIKKYIARNYDKICFLKRFIKQNKKCTVIAFLYDSMFLAILSSGRYNKTIISERADPVQNLSKITNAAFIFTMFEKADEMVFQSPDVMRWYRENTNVRGRVIFNPVKPDLPQRHIGERQKRIVNFCRISSQKNLHLLIKAFNVFSVDYPDYSLYIYGDSVGNGTEGYIESVNKAVKDLGCADKVHILPAQLNIHQTILDYAMFVSSSDFEGMSNSMLEAMAIGLPTICTDCPAGGARAVIKDHENGILVPVNDVEAMANAMKEVAGNYELAEKLSVNGTEIRETLSVDKIVAQWMEIIND